MVEELMEILPVDSPATVGLLLKVLEAIPSEVNFNIVLCVHHNKSKSI